MIILIQHMKHETIEASIQWKMCIECKANASFAVSFVIGIESWSAAIIQNYTHLENQNTSPLMYSSGANVQLINELQISIARIWATHIPIRRTKFKTKTMYLKVADLVLLIIRMINVEMCEQSVKIELILLREDNTQWPKWFV